jgi:excisionase family DNA binding protein
MIKFYKSPEAAKLLRVCVRTLDRMRKDGRLKATRTGPGGHYLYLEDDLLRAIGCEPEAEPKAKKGRPSLETIK